MTIILKVCVNLFRRFRLHILFNFFKTQRRQRKIVRTHGPEQKAAVKVYLFFRTRKFHDFHIHFAEHTAHRRLFRFFRFGPVTVLQCDTLPFIIRERKIRQAVDELIQADYLCGRPVFPDNYAAGLTNGDRNIIPARQCFMPRTAATHHAHTFRVHKAFHFFRSFRPQLGKLTTWKIVFQSHSSVILLSCLTCSLKRCSSLRISS